MNDNPFSVICLNETWLNSTWTDSELALNGYNLIRDDRTDLQRGGGTAIYYSTTLAARQKIDFCQDIEATYLEIIFPNLKKIPSTYHLTLNTTVLKFILTRFLKKHPVKALNCYSLEILTVICSYENYLLMLGTFVSYLVLIN